MSVLKKLHNSGIKLGHDFNLRRELGNYEKDIKEAGAEIPYEDYPSVRMKAEEVLDWIDSLNRPKTIAHIDSVKDNFIFTDEGLKMIDWEYAGMADPLLDLAMSAIYSYMSFDKAKELIKVYSCAPVPGRITEKERFSGQEIASEHERVFGQEIASEHERVSGERKPESDGGVVISPETFSAAGSEDVLKETEPQKIFESRGGIALKGLTLDDAYALVVAYMGLGGLLWALWGIYKMALGESFGDYTLKMYRYFKDSCKILRKLEKN
jgi:thiamine kinase-like enzyme